jgi:hypothetical protein
MEYFKNKYNLIISLFAFIILGCSTDEGNDNSPLVISVTNFEPSYDQVKINWEVSRPNGVIIEDLLVCRSYKNDETNYSTETVIANLPSNETTFTDNDVPYTKEVIYSIKINYKDERNKTLVINNLTSEPKKFIRELVTFDRVPFQVQKDLVQENVFHILEKEGLGSLKRYNSVENKITAVKTFSNGSFLNNKFHFVNNTEIFVADTQGKISRVNTDDYKSINTYSTNITNNLNAFSVAGSRIYYQDKDQWCYYDITAGVSTRTGLVSQADYLEPLNQKDILYLYCKNGNSGLNVYGFTTDNCNNATCFPFFYNNNGLSLKQNSVDANILSWNYSRTKFISSINGCIFNSTSLKEEKRLNDITGKKYFQFAFDKDNNIYATVQGEKIIHKFNSNYELIEVIKTKLYPFFPLVTDNDLKVIGGYEPVSYWSFEYGYNYNFSVKCAIEPIIIKN